MTYINFKLYINECLQADTPVNTDIIPPVHTDRLEMPS